MGLFYVIFLFRVYCVFVLGLLALGENVLLCEYGFSYVPFTPIDKGAN